MIEKWTESLGQSGAYGALLINLPKALDCLTHELVSAKLYVYGVDMSSIVNEAIKTTSNLFKKKF